MSGGKKTHKKLKTENKFRGKSEVLDINQYMLSINARLCWLYFMKNKIIVCIFIV